MTEKTKIRGLYFFPNGMCGVIGVSGEQIGELQGRQHESLPRLLSGGFDFSECEFMGVPTSIIDQLTKLQ